jgi:hypothetical protein
MESSSASSGAADADAERRSSSEEAGPGPSSSAGPGNRYPRRDRKQTKFLPPTPGYKPAVYQMAHPAPDVPGGLRFLLSFASGRSMLYKRRYANGVLQDLHVADVPTAQVIAQSARAAGAPRSEGGERGDLWNGRINSADAVGLEVTVRLDLRLPAPAAGRRLNVPRNTTASNKLFGVQQAYEGVRRGSRASAEAVTEADRLKWRHCASCMKPITDDWTLKAKHGEGTYFLCSKCYYTPEEPWRCALLGCICTSAKPKRKPTTKQQKKRSKGSFGGIKAKVARKRRRADDGQYVRRARNPPRTAAQDRRLLAVAKKCAGVSGDERSLRSSPRRA